ncbi:MAG: hypothetical protein MJZ09_00540 [Bacteroidales bacterium]|nr:hypothetical protein [Bacteroidales bacterium]
MSAQDHFSTFSSFLSPEKLYVQTDRDVYNAGDTVCFKAYLRNASDFASYKECNYIYVELLSTLSEQDPVKGEPVMRERVRNRVKVKRGDDGRFIGYIAVPDNLATDVAVLRGYSYWMMNKEPEYMFSKNISIRNPLKDDYYDQLVKADERSSDKYLELGLQNPFKKVSAPKKDIEVQFLPESGRYRPGEAVTFGVRSVASDGKGCRVAGSVYADGEKISDFETSDRGFGRLRVIVPEGVKTLEAKAEDAEGFQKTVKLPAGDAAAPMISCMATPDVLRAVFSAGEADAEALKVIAYDRNEIYFDAPFAEASEIVLAMKDLIPGINHLALVTSGGDVLAERAFFVQPQGTDVNIVTDKENYDPKELISCSVDLPHGDYALSVTDDMYAPVTRNGYNIVSYFLLGSELPVHVEDSWRYLDPTRPLEERVAETDLLMLTLGWTYYDLPEILAGRVPLPVCGKEYSQSITGTVLRPLRFRKKKMNISFLAPSIHYSSIHVIDSTGNFVLDGLDFPYGTKFLVSSESLGGNRMFTPVLDNDVFAKEHSYFRYMQPQPYDIFYKFAAMPEYFNEDGSPMLTLASSYITANRSVSQKNLSPFPEYTFKPGQYRSPEQMKPYETYDIPSYVTMSFPGVRIDTTSTGEYALVTRTEKVSTRMTINSGWQPILVYIDRMVASYDDLLSYTIADLEGLAFITGTDASKFGSYETTVTPRGVLMIKTRQLEKVPSNVSAIHPLGWQRKARRYCSAYEDGPSGPGAFRPTLYWNPSLEPVDGTAEVHFHASNHSVPCTVTLEGITSAGVPVFVQKNIVIE